MPDKIQTVRFLIRAFIPDTIVKSDGTEMTKKLTGGPFANTKVIPGPPVLPGIGYFSTDNRSFDASLSVTSRMHCATRAS